MVLRPYYEGLVIREGTSDECTLVASEYGVKVTPGYLFVLGENLSSFVVSGKPQWHEDEGGTDDPSWFGHMVGTL
ncbi:hypothetical protein GCM10010319_53940 [Streptomyces blastmyceticus]|uniref:Thioredoxin-like fold domain-containing protein n=1 Tax=Streptomyces blastmyceticus TaxID=68180 RepID=A0ABN0XP14_9ACTN